MLLVIFGAGASYDSGPPIEFGVGDGPPPLAKDLVSNRFDKIAAEHPLSLPIIDRLRSRMGSDETRSLETELALLVDQSLERAERREQLMVFRFYLEQVVRKTTLDWQVRHSGLTYYMTFINQLYDLLDKTGPVRLATFNYDRLIEGALEAFYKDWRFQSFEDYLRRDDFQVFKLHGSIGWSRRIKSPTDFEPTVNAAAALAGQGLDFQRYGELVPAEHADRANDEEVLAPALAIPLANKTDFECPPSHLEKLREDLADVDRVVIIGWRAGEAHAVALLGQLPKGTPLMIVSGSEQDGQEVLDNLQPISVSSRRVMMEHHGFGTFIGNLDEWMSKLLVS